MVSMALAEKAASMARPEKVEQLTLNEINDE
jgi:hypothetical protein